MECVKQYSGIPNREIRYQYTINTQRLSMPA